MQPQTRMTRDQQRERRERMAAAVRDMTSLGTVAAKFGVSIETVKNACRTYAPQKLYTPAAAGGFRRAGKRTPAMS